MKPRITAIYRQQKHSPNLSEADARIVEAVAQLLKNEGYEVAMLSEEEFVDNATESEFVINMCRTPQALDKLQAMEQEGVVVINSAHSIRNCSRRKLTQLFAQNSIPHPHTHLIRTDETNTLHCEVSLPAWLKLPDAPTIQKDDICYVATLQELEKSLKQYAERGVKEVIVSSHLSGDLVKFYSVAGTQFIHTTYPTISQHSKFGYEKHNDEVKHTPFSKTALLHICNKAAEATGVKVFGGDCIVDEEGNPQIIDFNDWPSFSSCTSEAAQHIALMIKNEIERYATRE